MLWANKAAQIVGVKVHPYSMVGNTIPQGAANHMTLVKAFATGIEILISWSFLQWYQERMAANFTFEPCNSWSSNQEIFAVQMSPWSLDQLLIRTLITWFHFDPSRKCFTRWLPSVPLYGLYIPYFWLLWFWMTRSPTSSRGHVHNSVIMWHWVWNICSPVSLLSTWSEL